MTHALIVEGSMAISRAVEARLVPLGFASFDRVWTGQQAVHAAEDHLPDLVIIGDTISGASPEQLARLICSGQGTPVVLMTAATCALYQPTPDGMAILGPFRLSEIERAVALSTQDACVKRAA